MSIVVITGIDGIGKTELALQYAQYFAQKQPQTYGGGICWLRARPLTESNTEFASNKTLDSKNFEQDVGSQIVTYAQTQLGLTLPDSAQPLLDRVAFCWANWPEGDVLLVLDDVTDYGAIKPYLPPLLPRFKLLITTGLPLERAIQTPDFQNLDLNILSEPAALDLLQVLVGEGRIQAQLESAKTLCAWLGYLPLGLQLVGQFLSRHPDWSLTRLQRRLIEKRLDAKALCRLEPDMTSTHESVAAAFELSWQELSNEAQQLSYLLGLFALAPLPWSLLEQGLPDRSPQELEKIREQELIASGLLQQVGEDHYQLHPLIRSFFQAKLQIAVEQGA